MPLPTPSTRRRDDPRPPAARFGTAVRSPAVAAKLPAHRRFPPPRPSTRNRPLTVAPKTQANFIGALLLAAAYGFLNQPAPPQPVLREATIVNAEEATFFDVGLDDASIPFDDGITAARKCGFCMG